MVLLGLTTVILEGNVAVGVIDGDEECRVQERDSELDAEERH